MHAYRTTSLLVLLVYELRLPSRILQTTASKPLRCALRAVRSQFVYYDFVLLPTCNTTGDFDGGSSLSCKTETGAGRYNTTVSDIPSLDSN
jgi:hypothetical protein